MKQIFRPNANIVVLVSIFVLVYIVVGVLWSLIILDWSNYTRRVNIPITQPVQYSHQLHAGSLGMDCRYCHANAEVAAYANVPPTETCMTCHHEILTNSPQIQPILESFATDTPIEWIKVHDVPDFVYFNHSAHINAGFGCTECHGQVDEMPVVWRAESLSMGWCLDCHRNPAENIRPRDEVWNMDYVKPDGPAQLALGQQLIEEYNINVATLDNCYICHR
jgi:hypothetical protein